MGKKLGLVGWFANNKIGQKYMQNSFRRKGWETKLKLTLKIYYLLEARCQEKVKK